MGLVRGDRQSVWERPVGRDGVGESTGGYLTLPSFHVHQNFDNSMVNGGKYEQENAGGGKPAVHAGVQS